MPNIAALTSIRKETRRSGCVIPHNIHRLPYRPTQPGIKQEAHSQAHRGVDLGNGLELGSRQRSVRRACF